MLVLAAGTIELVQMVTSGTADIDYHTSTVDHTTSGDTFAARQQKANVASAATTTIVSAPGAGKIGNVKWISARNKHASSANTLTFRHTDGTTTVELFKTTLQAGESVCMNSDGVWFVYDTNGGVKVGASAASDTLAGLIQIATQGDMEAASNVTVAVTPGRAHFHPGMAKFWAQVTGAGTPALTTNYNVTSVADTAVGRMTVTIGTDFSSANWCCQVSVFTTNVTGDEGIPNINAKAAGTVEVGNRIITPAFGDPNVGYDVTGWGDQA
jgi:hypothetical protein